MGAKELAVDYAHAYAEFRQRKGHTLYSDSLKYGIMTDEEVETYMNKLLYQIEDLRYNVDAMTFEEKMHWAESKLLLSIFNGNFDSMLRSVLTRLMQGS